MDAEKNTAEHGADAGSPAASDNSTAQWSLILLVLCAVGAGLLIGILALQVTEYLFYKAPPNVWPQLGADGTVSAPVALSAPASSMGPTSAPVAASVSAPVPAAVKP